MWSPEIRKQAIAEISLGYSLDDVSKKTGVPKPTLHSWKRRVEKSLKRRSRNTATPRKPKSDTSKLDIVRAAAWVVIADFIKGGIK